MATDTANGTATEPHAHANGDMANGRATASATASVSNRAATGHNTLEDLAAMQEVALQRHQQQLHSDPELAAAGLDDRAEAELEDTYERGGSCNEMLQTICRAYAKRRAFGYSADGSANFSYVTYGQFYQRVLRLAAGLAAESALEAGSFFGICGFASIDWINCELACQYLGGVNVALPTNITAEDVAKVINEAELVGMACSVDELATLAPVLGACRTLRTFIVMEHEGSTNPQLPALVKQVRAGLPEGCRLLMLGEVMRRGKRAPVPRMFVPGRDGAPADALVSLYYTSGSTGLPKGAMYTDKLWRRWWLSKTSGMGMCPSVASIQLGFLPLNHILGRNAVLMCMRAGGYITFVRKSDMSTFFEDMAAVRPTTMLLIPRLANMMYDKLVGQLEQVPGGSEDAQAAHRQEAMRKFRDEDVGGRLVYSLTGSSPIAPEVLVFLRDALQAPTYEGYGSTEAGYISTEWEMNSDNVTEWKLVDVPELGYFTTDKPFPRGELVLKTRGLISCYYKHPKATAELFDKDGFYVTGDIMRQESPTRVVWIDRKKNVLKLAQGEFVSLGRLEGVYKGGSIFIHQVFLYGNGLRSYILAVVVPSEEALALGDEAEMRRRIRMELDDVARRRALQGYEIPRDFIIDREPFSKANHLLTDSGKPATGRLRSKYKDVLEALYAQHEERQRERMRAIRAQGGQSGTAERVKHAVELTLGLSEADLAKGDAASFAQLGGDSLAAIQFARSIDELCGVPLPVSFVLDHSNSLAAITAKVDAMLHGGEQEGVTFELIHGQDTAVIRAADLALDRFLPPAEGQAAPKPASELPAEPEVVLLTGANGFLGRFLLLDLLQRVSRRPGGYVAAIVRGTDDAAARARLRKGLNTGDADLLATFDRLAEGHLQVYAGDLAKPRLGLKLEVYARLAAEVDTIVHNGALVNHAFSYRQLFEPNVLGTVEVMRLAITTRTKALTFISSVGVVGGISHPLPVREEEVGTKLAMELPGDGGYALGYGATKWASEVQLQQLHERYGVPVSIFRCGMILAHSRYIGQINQTDFFTRLLAGICYTGLAPASFYKDPSGPDRHFDGMPVEFVAGGIAGVLSHHRSGIDAYHVVNPHWSDGLSLDAIVSWVAQARGGVRRVQDYGQWYEEFKAALEGLDATRQAASPLPIIHQWSEPMGGPGTKFEATKMRAGVCKFTAYEDVPHLDRAFILQNLRHMEALRIVGPAP